MEILFQTCLMPLSIKTQNDSFLFIHELKHEMHADLKYIESLENKIDELESDKVEFSNMYDMILQECVSNDVKCSCLLSLSNLDALDELQCLYLHKVKECNCLAQKLSKQTEFVTKDVHNELLQRFAKVEKHSISLEIALQKCKEQITQLILFIVDSGCTKHMTGNLKLLCNFIEKFLGTVRFSNDQFAPILGYGDLVQGNITINRVYYVKGLNYNLFSVSQFCDADLEVAFTKSTLSHLNFDYINLLLKKDVMIGLLKLKYVKGQLCSSCELSKAKSSSFKSKAVPSLKGRLNLLPMDLCGPMRVASINGKKYILSKGYRVYNKRTRMIVESIYIRFDEIKEVSKTSVANDTSGLVPQQQKASDYDNSDPVPQRQDVSSSADAHVPSQQELDLLFGPLY
nr:integrase, catalytic region, zinc finger, CCHC-type, peptidase aspartic, catalytic [Tanacetum cinerariifolium]